VQSPPRIVATARRRKYPEKVQLMAYSVKSNLSEGGLSGMDVATIEGGDCTLPINPATLTFSILNLVLLIVTRSSLNIHVRVLMTKIDKDGANKKTVMLIRNVGEIQVRMIGHYIGRCESTMQHDLRFHT